MSGLVKVPASAVKPAQLPFESVPVSRVTVRDDVSSPAPPELSVPSASENVTEAVE